MDVHHEVAARRVLHDEAHVLAGLEAGEEVDQEGMTDAVHRLEDPLLTHEAARRRREVGTRGVEGHLRGLMITRPNESRLNTMGGSKNVTALIVRWLSG